MLGALQYDGYSREGRMTSVLSVTLTKQVEAKRAVPKKAVLIEAFVANLNLERKYTDGKNLDKYILKSGVSFFQLVNFNELILLHKNQSFPLRISSVNVNKSGYIY